MANQIIVTNTGNVQVAIEPTPNVQVQISRAAINTLTNVPNANYANFAGEAFDVSGSNVTGAVGLATFATTANAVAGANVSGAVAFATTANSVAVANVVGIGNIAVINLDGNLSNILYGNGIFAAVPNVSNVANANFANFAGTAFNVAGANVSGAVAFATTANSVAGANVSGEVAFAATANSVAGANVSGEVAFAATANSVAGANVSGQVGNALVAGTVYTAAQPNITSLGTLNGLTSVANITAPYFIGNVVGNISGNFTVPGANTDLLFNTNGNADASSNLQFNKVTNVLSVNGNVSATYYTGNGSQLTDINGANVTGQVANALVAGTVYTNAQPNITSVGTLAGLEVSGNITPNANIAYDIGNTTNRFKDLYLSGSTIFLGNANLSASGNSIVTNGSNVNGDLNVTGNATVTGNLIVSGNLSYINVVDLRVEDPIIEQGAGPNGTPLTVNDGMDRGQILQYFTTAPVSAYMGWKNNQSEFEFGSNVSISNNVVTVNTFGNVRANVFIGNLQGIANFATVANSVAGANVSGEVANATFATTSGTTNSVAGANVSGAVAFATTANSVAAANVSGLGNIATTNYDGNGSNVLYGNGGFFALPIISNVANANFANFAGEAFNVSGANVTGAVGLATFATTANAVAGANVSGAVAFATTANAVAGANVVGEVANANYATYSGSSFSVSGANVVGTVANATHAVSSDLANSVSGANVVGQVGNALIAGTVYDNAQPNITSVGTLTTLSVTGGITSFANIAGDYFLGNGALLTGVGDFSAALGYHGSFFSNVTQTIASTTTAYPITLNNTSPGTYGVFVASNSRVTFTYAGTYNIQYSIQFQNTDNNLHDASVWLRKNGVDVPDSNSVFGVTARRGAINGQTIGAINYIEDVNANDYYELIWQAENISVSLEYIPPGTTPTSPAAPSVIVTAVQVTNVQAATLSGNLTGDLIGNTFGLTGTSFINIIGNISGNVFTGNGSGLTGIVGVNVTGFVANASHANISDVANVAYSVSGANVSGFVANATHATVSDSSNSVTGGNVIGAVGLATFATTANAVAGANVSGFVANATHATVADSANAVAGANVSGAVGLATFATTANAVAGANVSGAVAFATTANNVAVANVSGIGNIATVNLTGSTTNVLYGNGVFAAVSGGSGTPGGANTELQYNNNGTFGGISAVTWNGSNISLGAIGNVKITGGSNNYILATDGTGNLSFSTKTNNLTIGTRTISVNIPITDYTMNVQGRTGNISVNVN